MDGSQGIAFPGDQSIFKKKLQKGLDSHAEPGYAFQSRAEQSRAEQSRAEQSRGLTVPFLRLADVGRLKLNTPFVMDNRRI